MDTITTIASLLTFDGSAQAVTVALTPSDRRLIAAAPELYAVLREIAHNPACRLATPDLRERAQAAVRKAEGES